MDLRLTTLKATIKKVTQTQVIDLRKHLHQRLHQHCTVHLQTPPSFQCHIPSMTTVTAFKRPTLNHSLSQIPTAKQKKSAKDESARELSFRETSRSTVRLTKRTTSNYWALEMERLPEPLEVMKTGIWSYNTTNWKSPFTQNTIRDHELIKNVSYAIANTLTYVSKTFDNKSNKINTSQDL
jgi:hypothetical protein